jgi:hypothetical protein
MTGLQCEKALYLSVHEPALAPPIGAAQQAVFDQGHEVGLEARKRFPGGVLISARHSDAERAVEETRLAIGGGALAVFEATFIHRGILIKADILRRASIGADWDLIEVKSSSGLKEQYLPDAAIQAWVIEGAGLKLQSISIQHINTKYVFPEGGDLFTRVDVTKEVRKIMPAVVSAALNFQTLLERAGVPAREIGPQCESPYPCPFQGHCWRGARVPVPGVFDLPGLRSERKWELYRAGQGALDKLDPEEFTPLQQRVIQAGLTGRRFVDPEAIRRGMKEWTHPYSYLDFETVAWALPRYTGTRPFQQVPFQFSCHVQGKAGGPIVHFEYLHDEDSDPRRALAEALIGAVATRGSVIAYNKTFEATVIRGLAKLFTGTAKEARLRGIVDPHPVVKAAVYDPAFHGSFSIKDVAPALLGRRASYEGMSVADGGAAQAAYAEMIAPGTAAPRRSELRAALLEYCRKDTMAMVGVVEWLRSVDNI